MPFFIRKALSFGPIRFNLSKSGVGISAGVTGFRLGSGPAGNYVHAGRHGLYYKKFFSEGKKGKNKVDNNTKNINTVNPDETIIDSGSVLNMIDSNSSDLIKEINTKNKLTSYFPISIIFCLIINVIFYSHFNLGSLFNLSLENMTNFNLFTIISQIILITASIYFCFKMYKKDLFRKTTVLLFELDDDLKDIYEKVYNSIEELKTIKKISNVFKKVDVHYDRKYHAGAGELVDKTDVNLFFKNPKFLKTNIDPPCIPAGKESLYFLPTTLLVCEGINVGSIPYNEIKVTKSIVRFIEDGNVPSDAKVVDSTWEKVNKDGSPDRRFSSNRELPIVEYDVLKLESNSGLNEMFYFSKSGVIKNFINNIKLLGKYYNSQKTF